MIGGIARIGAWSPDWLYDAGAYSRRAAESGAVSSSAQKDDPRLMLPGVEEEDLDPNKTVEKGVDDPIAKLTGKTECQTCKNRKYVDGSDEQVSFKSAAKINPNAVESRVRAHEQEHVANAYDKAEQNDGKVLQASVTLKYAICPECGRSYCAGGVTNTMIKYGGDKPTPYDENAKSFGQEAALGNHLDIAV